MTNGLLGESSRGTKLRIWAEFGIIAQGINTKYKYKTRQNKKRSRKKRTRDLWNTRSESQIQTKLDQPSRKNVIITISKNHCNIRVDVN